MPPKRSTTVKKTKSTVEDIVKGIDWDDFFNTLEFSDKEAKDMIDGLTITGTGITPEQVDTQNWEYYQKALTGVKFAAVEDKDSELNSVLPMANIQSAAEITEVAKDRVQKMVRRSVGFAMLHGNVTAKKYWFEVEKVGEMRFYACFPDLNIDKRRSVLVHVYRDDISKLLQKHDNSLITILKRSGIEIHESKRKFCFPKGHLLCNPGDINECRKEIAQIFTQMAEKNVEARKFDMPWFTKEGSWESISKDLEKKS